MAFSNLPAPLLHSGGISSVFSVNSNSKSPTCFFPKDFMWGLIIEAFFHEMQCTWKEHQYKLKGKRLSMTRIYFL